MDKTYYDKNITGSLGNFTFETLLSVFVPMTYYFSSIFSSLSCQMKMELNPNTGFFIVIKRMIRID